MLVGCGLALTGFSLAYAVLDDYRLMLGLVLLHGVFWSGLLSASSAYMTDIIPEAPAGGGDRLLGPVHHRGRGLRARHRLRGVPPRLDLAVRGDRRAEPPDGGHRLHLEERPRPATAHADPFFTKGLLEWRVLLLSFTLFLYSFGYGGITSFVALYADANHVAPKGIFFTVMSVVILLTRPLSGRAADRRRLQEDPLPLAHPHRARPGAAGGQRHPGGPHRRGHRVRQRLRVRLSGLRRPRHDPRGLRAAGAAFGGILAAFDTGIGTGSIVTGWIIHRFGYSRAYVAAAVLAALAMPFFVLAEKRLFPSGEPAELL